MLLASLSTYDYNKTLRPVIIKTFRYYNSDKEYNAETKDVDIFSAALKSLYKCEPETSVKADVVGITISKVALISFNTEKAVSSKSGKTIVFFIPLTIQSRNSF